MRILSLIGSVFMTIYGIWLPAISTAILNGALIFVNIYHIIKLVKEHKKELANSQKTAEFVNTDTLKK